MRKDLQTTNCSQSNIPCELCEEVHIDRTSNVKIEDSENTTLSVCSSHMEILIGCDLFADNSITFEILTYPKKCQES